MRLMEAARSERRMALPLLAYRGPMSSAAI